MKKREEKGRDSATRSINVQPCSKIAVRHDTKHQKA